MQDGASRARQAAQNDLVLSFLSVRRAIGALGFFLPVALALYGLIAGDLRASMSAYFYSPMREIFVGTLCAQAVFLWSYEGYRDPGRMITDKLVARIASVAAALIALAPTNPPGGAAPGLFAPGERVRLRFVNGAAMTFFDVRIPGLKLTVVAADGQDIRPVDVDEFRIAPAETFDVIVQPERDEAYVVFAQAMDRSGHARITLAPRMGMRAPSPALDQRALLTMDDMGHGSHAMAPGEMACGANMDHSTMSMPMPAPMQAHPASETGNPFVDMQTMSPAPRLDDPGIGLRDNGRRVLRYADLRSLHAPEDDREPSREIELHLTGHMERFAWGFDGIKFSDAEPVRLKYGERVRFTLVNDTMMEHPVHLHGMWSDLEDADGKFLVRKHTISIPPGTKRSFRVTADALGRWAFHCHMLMHMEAGMMREVRVEE